MSHRLDDAIRQKAKYAINDYAGSFQRNRPCRCENQVDKNNGGGGIAKVCVNERSACESES